MRWLYKLPLRFRSLFKRGRVEQELTDELRFHLEKLAEENAAKGMTPEQAHYAALRELGGVDQIREDCRDMRRVNYIENFLEDLRYGLRMLVKNPGFAAAAVVTLALGIGANTTIFSVAWRPLRYRGANRLLVVWETRPDGSRSAVSAPTYLDWRDQNTCFAQLAAARNSSVALRGNPPIPVPGAQVSRNFFDTFGLQPELGRFFSDQEFRPDAARVALLSHEVWQTHFGGEAGIVGKSIRLNGETYVVAGVVPADFEFFGRMDIWMPLVLPRAGLSRETRDLLVVGRM